MCEKKRERLECSFVSDERTFLKHAAHPYYHRSIMINDKCSITLKRARSWHANQPIHLALSITQTARYSLLRSFYEQITPTLERFGLKAYCIYTDSTYKQIE